MQSKNNSFYKWVGIDRTGRVRRGWVRAIDRQSVCQRLARCGMVPLAVRQSWHSCLWQWVYSRARLRRLSLHQATAVCQSIAALVRGGVPFMGSVLIVRATCGDAQSQQVLAALEYELCAGRGIGEAFAATAEYWPVVVCAVMRAGQHSGQIDTLLQQLADSLRSSDISGKKRMQAVLVPFLTLGVAFIVGGAVLTVVVPQVCLLIADQGAGAQLHALMKLSSWVSEWGVLILMLISVVPAGVWHLLGLRAGMRWWRDAIVYWVPVVGPLSSMASGCLFARVLPVLLTAGVPLCDALRVVASVSENRYWRWCIEGVADDCARGRTLGQAWQQVSVRVVPPLIGQSMSIARSHHGLVRVCEHVATLLASQLEYALTVQIALIQPVLLIVIGIGVLWMISFVSGPLLMIMEQALC